MPQTDLVCSKCVGRRTVNNIMMKINSKVMVTTVPPDQPLAYSRRLIFVSASVHFRRIIHSEEKVFSVTFVESVTKFYGYRPDYRHLTPKVDRSGFCPVRFLCHGNGSPEEILSTCLAQENREMYP
jgi:hypothetical protein